MYIHTQASPSALNLILIPCPFMCCKASLMYASGLQSPDAWLIENHYRHISLILHRKVKVKTGRKEKDSEFHAYVDENVVCTCICISDVNMCTCDFMYIYVYVHSVRYGAWVIIALVSHGEVISSNYQTRDAPVTAVEISNEFQK